MQGLETLGQPRAGLLRTAGNISVEIAFLDTGSQERIVLEVELLVFGADAHVPYEERHTILSTQAGVWYPAWYLSQLCYRAGPTSHSGPALSPRMVSNPVDAQSMMHTFFP
jgi:hypothetical protein